MIDIFALEKIKRIARNWEDEEPNLTNDQLNKMLSEIRKLVK